MSSRDEIAAGDAIDKHLANAITLSELLSNYDCGHDGRACGISVFRVAGRMMQESVEAVYENCRFLEQKRKEAER